MRYVGVEFECQKICSVGLNIITLFLIEKPVQRNIVTP